ncbi:hypothetical protein [Clostridium sp. AM42-4]|uniref:hypothetical protein n=1 Tax=Clostridium sp. AM42-4 TaxID=2292305 RepID=UPI000E536DD1|nr:hypothetical protein [Clostridium sp. AM42-4]RHS85483.1 hypothetical protein DW922_11465 [Clostridium sp. AM42-4]
MKLKDAHRIVKKMAAQADKKERTALKIACACMEKSMPKEPRSTELPETLRKLKPVMYCRSCNAWVIPGEDRYCHVCGQRVRW